MADIPDNIVPITSDTRTAAEKFSTEHDRELLTILFTDLVDSTKLQSDLGNVEAARLTELHRKIVRDELANYDAREIEWAGDSCLAVFEKPSDAVVFALKLQAELREVRQLEPRLSAVRIGLHLGEIVVRHHDDGSKHTEDLFGLQVSESARVMSLARGDQIYCTRAVFDNARAVLRGSAIPGVPEIAYANHGSYMLKGIPDPVEICEVVDADQAQPRPPEANEKCRPVRSTSQQRSRSIAVMAGAVALFTILAFGAGLVMRSGSGDGAVLAPAEPETDSFVTAPPARMRRYVLALPSDQPLAPPNPIIESSLDISPDGRSIAYRSFTEGGEYTVVRSLDALEGQVLQGSGGSSRQVFSPDGQWVTAYGYVDNVSKLLKFPLEGGPPKPLADMVLNFPNAWTDDGYLLYTPDYGHGLYKISANGGEPEVLTTLEEGAQGHAFPIPLPGGNGIVYTSFTVPSTARSTALVLDLRTGQSTTLLKEAGARTYLSNGFLILSQVGRLTALPFDVDTLQATGPPFDVTQPRMAVADVSPTRVAVSKTGTLVYVPIDLDETDALTPVWITVEGKEVATELPPDRYQDGAVSPDGRYVALVISNGDTTDIWMHDLERGATSRLTYGESSEENPVWARDSKSIYFNSTESGSWGIHRLNVFDSTEPELLIRATGGGLWPVSVSPDGSELIYGTRTGESKLNVLKLEDPGGTRRILDGPGEQWDGRISPNGQWIAYSSNESRRPEVYLQSYPDAGFKRQISTEGGQGPQWSHDGSSLYFWYVSAGSSARLVAVEIEFEPELSIGIPRDIAEGPYYRSASLDRSAARFLTFKSLSRDSLRVGGTELIVVENWHEEVRRLQRLE